MALDDLWYLADEADQRAEQTYHGLLADHDGVLEFTRRRRVSRSRFRTLADRIGDTGVPYGAHTIVYRPSGTLLLVRDERVGKWVLPGGQQDGDESLREAAERELAEEAGVEVSYDGLAVLTRVEIRCADHATWGVLPLYAAEALTTEPSVTDPDGEITAARWFDDLPAETRDRDHLREWRRRTFDG